MLTIITIVHFVITYNIPSQNLSIAEFLTALFTKPEFVDILVRTALFMVFYLVVYVIVSIGQQLQEERKKELIKRRQVQDDFSRIVTNLFSVVFSSSYTLLDKKHAYQVLEIATKQYLNEYALVHLRYDEISNIMSQEISFDETSYQQLKEKTQLGSKIAKRLQLAQKADDMVRSHYEGSADEKFKADMNKIQPEIISQIILLADVYVTLRSAKPYKRPQNHSASMEVFSKALTEYFDYKLQERFTTYSNEIKEIFNGL